jgi:ribosomal protein S27E
MEEQIECKICGEVFANMDDFQKHQLEKYSLPSHSLALEKQSYQDPCAWCGGKIISHGHPETAYAVECSKCDYLWDED